METLRAQAACERWRALIAEHTRKRRDAFLEGAAACELEEIDREYYLLIDSAFADVQTAESLEHLRHEAGRR